MPRTNTADVAAILNMDEVTDDLSTFILAANVLVTQKCASKTNPDNTPYYTDEHLGVIEQWLAAHFYKIWHPDDLRTEVSESAKNQIESKVDLGLAVTRYGQQAMILDSAGGLSELQSNVLNPKRKWGVMWLGREPEKTKRRVPWSTPP